MKVRVCLIMFFVFVMSLPVSAQVVYQVCMGDTLTGIAEKYLPCSMIYTRAELVDEIRRVNDLSSDDLSIGDKLLIPVRSNEPLVSERINRPDAFAAKGVYISKWSAGGSGISGVADRLVSLDANTIVFDAKDVTGWLSFRSPIPLAFSPGARYEPAITDVPRLISLLHLKGIHVVARVCVFKDMLMAGEMPHWRIQNDWLNPADPEVQAYMLALIRQMVDLGVDEIQLDYFRYPADDDTSTGIAETTRSEVIAGFLGRIHDITSSRGVLLSLDVFGIVIWKSDKDILVIGQDISMLKDHLEIISPMLYPSHFSKGFAGIENPADEPAYFVSRGITKLNAIVGDSVLMRPWLQAFPLHVSGPMSEFIRLQISAAQDSGASGWLLWSPGNRYDAAYKAMEARDDDMSVPLSPHSRLLSAPHSDRRNRESSICLNHCQNACNIK
ncbi:MAG: putative glycoside hydrolase [Thermodesulfobacteriota bacterium]|nr:putative glycoside hydrolase [Thermodesulfobacteriota bacterium]